MFKNVQTVQLFSVPVWAQQLEDATATRLNANLLRAAARLKAELPHAVPAGEGWQTRTDLHRLPEFAPMVGVIDAATRHVMNALKVVPTPFEITGCWMNMKPRGEDHGVHNHPNNFLSGVYYVDVPPGADRIVFHDFRMERNAILPRYTEETALTASLVRLAVRSGLLVMFPSWLMHSVAPNPTAHERVSLAFNIMFSDFAATLATPSWDWVTEAFGSAESND
jgi:uncharacterized protein (TIGR02466 family)